MNIGYILGPAGSGKSMMTKSLYDWMNQLEFDIISLNLDPGVVRLPYAPDIDIRSFVDYDALVDKYELGPNGGLIVAMDHAALAVDDLLKEIDEFGAEYMLVDFPGQIETIAFRSSGSVLVNELSKGNMPSGVFLIDPTLCNTASSFISVLLFGVSVTYRLNIPMNYIISKSDIMRDSRLDRINEWSENPAFLHEDLRNEDFILNSNLSSQIADIIFHQDLIGEFNAVSSQTNENLDVVFASLQRNWNSEDVLP